MSNEVIVWLKAALAKFEESAEVQTIEADVETIGNAAFNYIKTNGLADLYQVALTLVGAMVPGASWTGVLAAIEAQATADGKQLVQGAVAVVAAQAQADLIALGNIPVPTPNVPTA